MSDKFKIGDKVKAFGVDGVVIKINKDATYPVMVNFSDDRVTSFTSDGMLCEWHKEPSLVLVERHKFKKIVTMYKYARSLENNVWEESRCFYRDEASAKVQLMDSECYQIKCLEYTATEFEVDSEC